MFNSTTIPDLFCKKLMVFNWICYQLLKQFHIIKCVCGGVSLWTNIKVHYPKQVMYIVMLLIIIRIKELSVCKKIAVYI